MFSHNELPHLHYLLFPLCLSLQALLHFLQNFSFMFLLLNLEITGYFMKASYENKSFPSLLHFVIRECDKLLLTQKQDWIACFASYHLDTSTNPVIFSSGTIAVFDSIYRIREAT